MTVFFQDARFDRRVADPMTRCRRRYA